MERRQWCSGLPSSLGTIYRSGQADNIKHIHIFHLSSDFFARNLHKCNIFNFFVHKGRNVETVEVAGDSEFHTLSRLQPDTEYIVTIIPLYEGNTEGPVATARFKIGRCASNSSPQHRTSLLSAIFPLFFLSSNCTLFPLKTQSYTHTKTIH